MPGTGDVTYVLGPSLIALVLGVLIFVIARRLRRGPAIAARSAPNHGLPRKESDMSDPSALNPRIPAPRDPGDEQSDDDTGRPRSGRHLFVRLHVGANGRSVSRGRTTRR